MNSVKSLLVPARLALVLAAGLAASTTTSHAQLTATGTITDVPAGGGSFDYTITLHNSASSTASISSFWYAWIPGQFYLPSAPTSVAFPLPFGWTASPFTIGPNNSSIQFSTSSSIYALAPGGSYSFTYASMDTPAQEFGKSPSYAGNPPVGTSVVYQGAFLSSAGDTFVVQPAPEPSSIALLVAGSLGLLVAVRRGKLSRRAQV